MNKSDEVEVKVGGAPSNVLSADEEAEQIARFQARQDEAVAKYKAKIASPKHRKKVKDSVKTRESRGQNRLSDRLAARASGRFMGIVRPSVALYNMCGDNAYERTAPRQEGVSREQ